MDCRETREMLSAYHDGELPDADRAKVETHLRACRDCAAVLDSLVRIDEAAEVPDPGPRYWENFNRRLDERIEREEAPRKTAAVPQQRRGWMRQQLRYLIPAAAAAVLVVTIVRQMDTDRNAGRPAPVLPVPAAEEKRAPESPAPSPPAAAPRRAREAAPGRAAPEKKAAAPADRSVPPLTDEIPRTETGAILKDAAPPAPIPQAEAEPVPPQGGVGREPAAEKADRLLATGGDAGRTLSATKSKTEAAVSSKEEASFRPSSSACETARSLAAQGRFKEAEAAVRNCLSEEKSPPAQEGGLVLLAELLDRQHRFAEADSVIESAQVRFPRSRAVQGYQKQRAGVQSGRIPYPSTR
jgi:hypothetical protein